MPSERQRLSTHNYFFPLFPTFSHLLSYPVKKVKGFQKFSVFRKIFSRQSQGSGEGKKGGGPIGPPGTLLRSHRPCRSTDRLGEPEGGKLGRLRRAASKLGPAGLLGRNCQDFLCQDREGLIPAPSLKKAVTRKRLVEIRQKGADMHPLPQGDVPIFRSYPPKGLLELIAGDAVAH